MIAYLSGKILTKQPDSVVIDVGGVGYEAHIPLSTFYELGEAGADTSLHIHTHVREDALLLYGFKTARDRELFTTLLSVSGIGAKMGIAMLSAMSADEIILAVRTDDLARLTAIPGVGKKTAERMLIELRDKVMNLSASLTVEAGESAKAVAVGVAVSNEGNAVFDDALSALTNLGYQRNAAEKALKQAVQDGTEISVQKLLRKSLQLLAK
jgi:Holliday junction DNA helicase RuvA